ncbi:protein usf isoform X1 [Patella vulgata]|uniref:protein usf isoform X1 n=2 Tax=Patella vulgata TaxID=6465 RepID=UPI0024A9010E|nr:protein usf isoform X1 [Patella vulgata]
MKKIIIEMAAVIPKGQKVEIPSDNAKGPLSAYHFNDPKTHAIGVIILQEWWGVNKQIQDEAADIARRGEFSAICPDLYRGSLATNNEEAGHLMENLDWPGAIKDIEACAKFLLSKGCKKVGVTGFCMGGALSMAAAALIPEVSAAAPFYGIPDSGLADPSKIKVPIQCHFGDRDEQTGFSCPTSQAKLIEKLKEGNVVYEFYSYKDAGHAFTNKDGPNYKAEYYEQGLTRMCDFFKKHLL